MWSPTRKSGVLVQRRGRPATQQPQDQLLHEKTQVIYVFNVFLKTFCLSLGIYFLYFRWLSLFPVYVICYIIPKRAKMNRSKEFLFNGLCQKKYAKGTVGLVIYSCIFKTNKNFLTSEQLFIFLVLQFKQSPFQEIVETPLKWTRQPSFLFQF